MKRVRTLKNAKSMLLTMHAYVLYVTRLFLEGSGFYTIYNQNEITPFWYTPTTGVPN